MTLADISVFFAKFCECFEMAQVVKRKRGANFSPLEKSTLLNLVYKYKNVVSNNKTDGVSVAEKEKHWKMITNEFNTEAPNTILRSQDTLKRLYLNIVQATRKTAASERRELYKTGGGKKKTVIDKDPNYDLTLDIINKKTLQGMCNTFDTDYIEENENHPGTSKSSLAKPGRNDNFNEIDVEFGVNDIDEDIDLGQFSTHEVLSPELTSIISKNNEEPREEPSSNICSQSTTPKASTSCIGKNHTRSSVRRKFQRQEYDAGRRRPAVTALTSSHLGEKYEKLLDLRVKIAEVEVERVMQQKLHEQRENSLKIERLELEIKHLKKDLGLRE